MRLRRAFAFVSAAALFGVGHVLPAAATADPVPGSTKRPLRTVNATGEFYTQLSPSGLAVNYACAGIAVPDAAATIVTECSIWINGVFQANYTAGSPGDVAVSAGQHQAPVGRVTLCYQAKAMFTDGSVIESFRGCVSD